MKLTGLTASLTLLYSIVISAVPQEFNVFFRLESLISNSQVQSIYLFCMMILSGYLKLFIFNKIPVLMK